MLKIQPPIFEFQILWDSNCRLFLGRFLLGILPIATIQLLLHFMLNNFTVNQSELWLSLNFLDSLNFFPCPIRTLVTFFLQPKSVKPVWMRFSGWSPMEPRDILLKRGMEYSQSRIWNCLWRETSLQPSLRGKPVSLLQRILLFNLLQKRICLMLTNIHNICVL